MKTLFNIKASVYLFLMISLGLIVSCGDKEEDIVDPRPFLTTDSWYVSDFELSGGIEEQFMTGMLAVLEDSAYTFTIDGKFTSNDPWFGSETEGTWALSENNKFLTMTQDDESIEVEIVSVNSTKMKWKRTYKKEDLDYTKDLSVVFVLTSFRKPE